ncbi:hypothetical protein UG55_103618, partial [Frankia sp. EI5c]
HAAVAGEIHTVADSRCRPLSVVLA